MNLLEEQKIEMAKDIAEVRETGETNMFDYYAVVRILHDLHHEETSNYLWHNKKEFMNLLILSGKY